MRYCPRAALKTALSADCAAAKPSISSCSKSRFNSSRSEEHTSELQSLMRLAYDVFCMKKKKKTKKKYKSKKKKYTSTETQSTRIGDMHASRELTKHM